MFKRIVLPVATALSIAVLLVVPAEAMPGAGISRKAFLPMASSMAEHGRAAAPFGHVEFCVRNPSQCNRAAGQGSAARLSGGSWRMLQQVNLKVNGAIRPQSDMSSSGRPDRWSVGTSVGDCEDYALTKRNELIRRGWSPSSVLMATVRDRQNRSHAVLVAHTDRGDFVLDNQTGAIKPWDQTGYRWLKRQSTQDPHKWVSLSKESSSVSKHIGKNRLPTSNKARQAYLLAALSRVRGGQVAVSTPSRREIAQSGRSKKAVRKSVHRTRDSRIVTLNKIRKAYRKTARKSSSKARYAKRKSRKWVSQAFGRSFQFGVL